MNRRGSLSKPNSAKYVFFSIFIILLMVLLSQMTIFEAASVNLTEPLNNTAVTPSRHCEGGECCIMSECSCPNCEGRGDPGGICDDCGSDLCDNCGNCPLCGTSPCPVCRDTCYKCGSSNLCDTCNGCLDCGFNRDPECPGCGDVVYILTDIHDAPTSYDRFVIPPNDSGFEILLFAPFGMSAWAIFNVILTVTGVLLTFVAIMRSVRRKRSENHEVEKYVALFNVDSYVDTQTIVILNENERYDKRRRLGAFITMYALSTGAVLLLVLIQDFTGVTALFDWWSIVHLFLFAGILICNKLVYKKHEDANEALNASSLPWEVSL